VTFSTSSSIRIRRSDSVAAAQVRSMSRFLENTSYLFEAPADIVGLGHFTSDAFRLPVRRRNGQGQASLLLGVDRVLGGPSMGRCQNGAMTTAPANET
jgi:hypothetical protein